MIVLDLICADEHRFEGWFASNAEFERQSEAGLISCPVCNHATVRRLPSAPQIIRSSSKAATEPAALPDEILQQLIGALQQITAGMEDVGTSFAVEVRKIHYGDAESRPIKGQATLKEGLSLLEEGIEILALPSDEKELH